MAESIQGKVVVVAGGTGAIGSAIVAAMLEEGCRVVSLSRRIVERTPEAHPGLVSIRCDVTKARSVSAAAAAVRARFAAPGRPGIYALIYTVGHLAETSLARQTSTPVGEFSATEYGDYLRLYAEGFMRFVNALLGSVQDRGHIVSLGSALSRSCPRQWNAAHYVSAKAAQDELALWYRDRDPVVLSKGILVHRIAPTRVDCEFHRRYAGKSADGDLVPTEVIAAEIVRALRGSKSVDRVLAPKSMLRVA